MSTWAQPGRLRRPGRGLKTVNKSANSQFSKPPHTQKFGHPHVFRKEIDRGEAKVRDALNGDSSWDDDTLRSLMLRVQPGGHNAAVA